MKSPALLICTMLAGVPGIATAGNGVIAGDPDNWSLTENWSDYSTGVCQYDTFPFGAWVAQFDGSGCTQILASTHKLELKPAVSTAASQTHGALVTSGALVGARPTGGASLFLDLKLKTTAQLRTGSSPNPWEVGWVTWNGKYDTGCSCFTFNYFIPKTNGYELGMIVNNGGSQGQVFLATGSGSFPINTLYEVEVQQVGNVVDVWVNGTQYVHYTGTTVPFSYGWAVGPYVEDAQVQYSLVSGTRL